VFHRRTEPRNNKVAEDGSHQLQERMEILRVLGLADDYRAQHNSVCPDANFDSIFVTSLAPSGRLLGSWVKHPDLLEAPFTF